jgi:hypothetical protein
MFINLTKNKKTFKKILLCVFLSFPFSILAADTGLEETAGTAGIEKFDIATKIGDIISTILGFVGIFFLILMIYGGLMWMTAGGKEEQLGKAKKVITSAVIGMIVVFSAYAITYFVTETLLGQ